MFKSLITLFRGTAHEAVAGVVDANIMTVLDQQLRDCASVVDKARKSVALAIAQKRQEEDRLARTLERIADLEDRARAALEKGNEDLAREAAEVIANLEAERDASKEAVQTFDTEIRRLKTIVRNAEARLLELKRGQRLAKATASAQKLRDRGFARTTDSVNTLSDAEETLERLRSRQKEIDDANLALDEMDLGTNPKSVAEKLADAGCGKPIKSTADSVLDRLRGSEAERPADGGTTD